MIKLDNENLTKLIFKNLDLYKCNMIFSIINNRMLGSVILRILQYDDIFHSTSKFFTVLKEIGHMTFFTVLKNGDIVTEESDTIGKLKFWKHDSYKHYKTLKMEYYVYSFIEHPMNSNVVISSSVIIKVWDSLDNMKCLKSIKIYKRITDIMILVNRYLTCLIDTDQQRSHKVLIYDSQNNYFCVKILDNQEYTPRSAINLKNESIAIALNNKFIKIYDSKADFKCLKIIYDDMSIFNIISIPHCDVFLTGLYDGSIKVWDSIRYNCIKEFKAHQKPVHYLLKLPNGYFASCSDQKEIKIWDIRNFHCVKLFETKKYLLKEDYLGFLKDKRLVSVTEDELLICWHY
jgi:WD40 repeat protein